MTSAFPKLAARRRLNVQIQLQCLVVDIVTIACGETCAEVEVTVTDAAVGECTLHRQSLVREDTRAHPLHGRRIVTIRWRASF